jgi:hypothetical protein
VSTVREPTVEDSWRAGQLIAAIGDAEDWETTKRRAFQNLALIALTCTARRNGRDHQRRGLRVVGESDQAQSGDRLRYLA